MPLASEQSRTHCTSALGTPWTRVPFDLHLPHLPADAREGVARVPGAAGVGGERRLPERLVVGRHPRHDLHGGPRQPFGRDANRGDRRKSRLPLRRSACRRECSAPAARDGQGRGLPDATHAPNLDVPVIRTSAAARSAYPARRDDPAAQSGAAWQRSRQRDWSRSIADGRARSARSTASISTSQTGTVLGLLGPNGAGKTTTVRILATLLRPDAGSARVAGIDVLRDPQAVRRVIGLSGQYAAVDENLTGRENLWMFGRLYGLDRRGGAAPRRRHARALRPARRRRAGRQDVLRRHAPAARPRQRAHRPAAAPVPRRADHRPRPAQPPRHVGRHPRPGAARARRSCSRRSTSRRPTSSPTRSPSSTAARSSRAAPPTSSSRRSAASASRSSCTTAPRSSRRRSCWRRDGRATVEEHTRRITFAATGGAAQLVDTIRTLDEEGLGSTTSACGARRSTTCS